MTDSMAGMRRPVAVIIGMMGAGKTRVGKEAAQMMQLPFADADNEIEMSGYGLLSLRAAWQANEELGLSLKLDNLLDKDYAEATYSTPNGRFGYNSAGRTALFAVTWTPQL